MSHIHQIPVKLYRKELYDRIWTTPASRLAKEFGISDVGLAKICDRHRIPRPPRGYWAKLAVGRKMRQPALPVLDRADLEEIRIFRQNFAEGTAEARSTQNDSSTTISVPEVLQDPHDLIVVARRCLRNAKLDEDKTLYISDENCLDIRVAKASIDRALRIFDSLLKYWESLGGCIVIGRPKPNGRAATLFELHGDRVGISLSEDIDRVSTQSNVCRNAKYHNCKFEPTGRLAFMVDAYSDSSRTRWGDAKNKPLERSFPSLVKSMMAILESRRLARLDQECVNRQQALAQKVREETAMVLKREEDRRQGLMENLKSWKQAKEMREYLAAIQTSLASGKLRIKDDRQFQEWMDWAMWYADDIDPLVSAPPRSDFQPIKTVRSIGELELTRKTKSVVLELGVHDTDELYAVERQTVQDLCSYWCSTEWNEICRVLEGLGYDVRDRYR